MSNNDYVAPVNHGVLSATGSVALGAAGGAAKSIGKTLLWTIGALALVGFLWGSGLLAMGAALLPESVVAAGGGFSAAGGLGVGTLLGIIGIPVGAFFGAFTGLFGAGKGAVDAHERVSQERGAAQALEAQVAVYQAQANDNNKYNFAAQGSPMNPAGTTISAMQTDGRVNGQQLQRA